MHQFSLALRLSSALKQPEGEGGGEDLGGTAATEDTLAEEALVEAPASAEDLELVSERQAKWEEVYDATSGKVYYHHSETKETTWERTVQRPSAITHRKE